MGDPSTELSTTRQIDLSEKINMLLDKLPGNDTNKNLFDCKEKGERSSIRGDSENGNGNVAGEGDKRQKNKYIFMAIPVLE